MPTLAVTHHLNANLEALGQRNADLAARIRLARPLADATFEQSDDNGVAVRVGEQLLCSRRRPREEARRLVDSIDLVEHAVVVVLGFGAGWHVQRLVERGGKSTLLVVFEPDLSLLRSVFENIDHSSWLREGLVLFIDDADDRGVLAAQLAGAEAILGQGVHVMEHPASRVRLGDSASRFTRAVSEHVAGARTTLATTLTRSADTTRNLVSNIDHYIGGHGIADLANAACGCAAVIVSAGPSLHRNIAQLADRKIRSRCVIIAVQTALRPLLEANITPHFVTALDYHEISRRFYEDLPKERLNEVTLVADPKVHPVVLDLYPGPIRCCANGFLDRILGDAVQPMGELPAGATVAHLAMYLARYLGCDPVALVGQDLGFSDGLYYAPHAVIHEVWAPELNVFNSIAMMEWQRIARHRTHLRRTQDIHGRPMFTDAQMHTYLQQFERDFAGYNQKGLRTIDASEGGVRKQHTEVMPLGEFLRTCATKPVPSLALPKSRGADRMRPHMQAGCLALTALRARITRLGELSRDTEHLLTQMIEHQRDRARLSSLFSKVDANRVEVESMLDALETLNIVNQMGAFRRMKADRRLHMSKSLDPVAVQKRQLERDLDNVRWLAEASAELVAQLDHALSLLEPDDRRSAASNAHSSSNALSEQAAAPVRCSTIAALVPIDPHRNGRGLKRSLAARFGDRTILQATLERLGRSRMLGSIILLTPRSFDVEPLIDRSRIALPVEIEWCDEESPFGTERHAIAAARAFADTCWRGGIAGIGACDEALCPKMMHAVMERRGLSAAFIAAPDWPWIEVEGDCGCDALVRRHLQQPRQHTLVFTQAPAGMSGCVINASLMKELALRNRLSTIGGLLTYQPHAPQHDPIARDACVQSPHRLKTSLIRATFDSQRLLQTLDSTAVALEDLESHACDIWKLTPQHVTLELTGRRTSRGIFARSLGTSRRADMTVESARSILQQFADTGADDLTLTLHGAGDPLLHERFDEIASYARDAGFLAINIRTELLCDEGVLNRLLRCAPDVVSIDLNADRAVTYTAMMGVDRFREALERIEWLIEHRRRLTEHQGTTAFALPWVVPHLQRRAETYEDIDSFFDRWQHMLGTVVIADPPPQDPRPIGLTPAVTPASVIKRQQASSVTILSDGSVPLREGDFSGQSIVGSIARQSMLELWQHVRKVREDEPLAEEIIA